MALGWSPRGSKSLLILNLRDIRVLGKNHRNPKLAVALLDDILRLFGTNRTRVRWKWERLKTRLAAQKSRVENRSRAVTYAHKACLRCGHPADRFARRCVACGGRLPGWTRAKLTLLARLLIDSEGGFAATSVILMFNVAIYLLMFKQSGGLTPSGA